MNMEERERLLFLLILSKKAEFLKDGTNISFNEILNYLNDFYFMDEVPTKKKLLDFLKDSDKKEIVD
jgi:hypothetical protein